MVLYYKDEHIMILIYMEMKKGFAMKTNRKQLLIVYICLALGLEC